jgi:phospholipid transport system substrate-binding protein
MHPALSLVVFLVAAPGTATEAIQARDNEIRAELPKPGAPLSAADRVKIEATLTHAVDLEAMAKAALGKTWDEQSKAKRKEFLDAFMGAFRKAMSGQVDGYREAKTIFAPEQKMTEELVKVPTTLTIRGEPTAVDYTLKREGTEWRIVDITVDDVSTVENYRSSFGRIVQKEGFDALIQRLKKPAAG